MIIHSLLAKAGKTCLGYGFLKVFGWVKLARLEILLYSVAVLRNDQVLFSSLLIQHLKNQGVNRFSVREQMFIFAAPLIWFAYTFDSARGFCWFAILEVVRKTSLFTSTDPQLGQVLCKVALWWLESQDITKNFKNFSTFHVSKAQNIRG